MAICNEFTKLQKENLAKVSCYMVILLHTNTAHLIAEIPNGRESKLSMPQMMVVTNASMRKSCGAGRSEGGATTTCDTCHNYYNYKQFLMYALMKILREGERL